VRTDDLDRYWGPSENSVLVKALLLILPHSRDDP